MLLREIDVNSWTIVFSETMQNKDVYNLLLMKKKRNRPAFSVSCKGNKYKTFFQYLK